MAEPVHSQSALPIGAKLLHYRFGCELGRGGFGITYKAEDLKLDRLVTIKEYLPHDLAGRSSDYTVSPHSGNQAENFQSGLETFLQEAQTLAKFHHPNIVPVLDFFRGNGTAYLVMIFLQGQTLADSLARQPGGQISEVEVLTWLSPLLDGLKTIHAAGFLHRDIKPDNIFLQTNGNPILIDFGAARNALANRSRNLTNILTPGYAPIEQYTVTAAKQGPWTDLYALGAVIFRCLTGEEPISSPERQSVIADGETDPLSAQLRNLSRVVSPGLAQAVEGCLRVARKDRIQGVFELRQILENRLPPRPEIVRPNPSKEATESDTIAPNIFKIADEPLTVLSPKKLLWLLLFCGGVLILSFIYSNYQTPIQTPEQPLPSVPEIPSNQAPNVEIPEELYQKALSQDRIGKYAEAIELYKKAADMNHAKAQNKLGEIYVEGRKATRNAAEAFAWLQKAANQGLPVAQFNLGQLYDFGFDEFPENDVQAVNWYKKAAEQGHIDAQYFLGIMYANGQGVSKDEREAIHWYKEAADQGDAAAQKALDRLLKNQ
jgi:serine/threonine protein kinase